MIKFLRIKILETLILLFICVITDAQIKLDSTITNDTTDLKQLVEQKSTAQFSKMERDINQDVNVASKKTLSYRKTPSIVTVITEEEIVKSGARDMIDLLRQIPGLDFNADIQGVVGLSVRGNWAQEGKHLFLIDGQEINETLYGSVNYATNFPLSHIKKIEIIRGSGSAIYGGFSEYAVINIITKTGEDVQGFQTQFQMGHTANALGRLNASVLAGEKIKSFHYSFGAMAGTGHRSDQNYTDMNGNTVRLNQNNSQLNPTYLNFSCGYKGLSARFVYDNMSTRTQMGYGNVFTKSYPSLYSNLLTELKYIHTFSDKLNITTRLNFKNQKTYHLESSEASEENTAFEVPVQRYRANMIVSYDPTKKMNIIAGGEIFIDNAINYSYQFASLNSNKASFTNLSAFTQFLYKNKFITPTLGFRLDKNTSFSQIAISPRFALVSRIGKVNLKCMYNRSFRAPTIFNIALTETFDNKGKPIMVPETSDIFEFEIGVPITRNSYFTLNLFDITTQNPILYNVSETDVESYKNGDKNGNKKLGSRGFETEFKVKDAWGYFNINYSFYTDQGMPQIDDYNIRGYNLEVSNINLGIAQHKFNLNAAYNITQKISIAPSASMWSNRYAATQFDDKGFLISRFEPTFLANVFVNFNDAFNTKGLQIGFGCYDIFNKKFQFLQTSQNFIAPMPALSREFIIKLTYNLSKNS